MAGNQGKLGSHSLRNIDPFSPLHYKMCKLVLLLLTAGAARGFHTAVQPWAPSRSVRGPCSPWPLNPEPLTASAPLRPRVRATERQARVRGGLVALRGTRSLLEQWAEACDKNGVPAPEPSLPAADTATLLKAVAGNKPKRSDTFAEVGGGRGEAMAAALAECGVEWGQAALFLPENMQQQAEGVFATAKKMNRVFEPCQIILGNVQDLTAGSRMMTYFDVVFADTRSADWGAGTDGPASTLSAAAGQFCLEGSRLVTVGRKLVDEEGIWSFALLQSLPLSCGAAGYVWEVTRSGACLSSVSGVCGVASGFGVLVFWNSH